MTDKLTDFELRVLDLSERCDLEDASTLIDIMFSMTKDYPEEYTELFDSTLNALDHSERLTAHLSKTKAQQEQEEEAVIISKIKEFIDNAGAEAAYKLAQQEEENEPCTIEAMKAYKEIQGL